MGIFRKHGWAQLDPIASQAIAAAWMHSSKLCQYRIGACDYSLDLVSKEQTNLGTGTKRLIRRVPCRQSSLVATTDCLAALHAAATDDSEAEVSMPLTARGFGETSNCSCSEVAGRQMGKRCGDDCTANVV